MSTGCTCLACRVERAIIAEIEVEDGTGEFDSNLVLDGCARVLAGARRRGRERDAWRWLSVPVHHRPGPLQTLPSGKAVACRSEGNVLMLNNRLNSTLRRRLLAELGQGYPTRRRLARCGRLVQAALEPLPAAEPPPS